MVPIISYELPDESLGLNMQASLLEQELGQNYEAIFLDAPEEVLLERCQGRLLHEASGA